MATRKPRAVVIGAGWAGEGHTIALQNCGVEVVGICARDQDAVRKAADRLGVANPSTDWRQSLTSLRPDIVTLATPAGLRTQVVEQAARLGCHILCDKPLAATGAEAEHMLRVAEEAGVKHAYASTHRYGPSVQWAAELIADGAIGKLREIDLVLCSGMFSELKPPWSWLDSLGAGGGALNNGHTHVLGILERITGGKLAAVAGEARCLRTRAPFVPDLHDFRVMTGTKLSVEEAATLEWRACDVDGAYSALHRFSVDGDNAGQEVVAYVKLNLAQPDGAAANGWHFYGERGALFGKGMFNLELFKQSGAQLEPLPVPQRLLDGLPQAGNDVQSKWVALMRDFVADIQGAPRAPYLTFRDGWRYQAAIDAIRQGAGWVQVPA